MCSSFLLKFQLSAVSEEVIQHCCMHIIYPNRHHISSLQLLNMIVIDRCFQLFTLDSSFVRLESLVLHYIDVETLLPLLFKLCLLPRLFSLTISLYYGSQDFSEIYRRIFSILSLKYNKFTAGVYKPFISLPIASKERFSNIEYLVIHHDYTLKELLVLLSYTPRLSHLILIQSFIELDKNIAMEIPITLANLTHISINPCHLQFDDFKALITKISSQLQVLRINTWAMNDGYLYADKWEQLISQHMPYLRKLHFEHGEFLDNDFGVIPHQAPINRFTSSFWIERQWFFQLIIGKYNDLSNHLVYAIHPYRYIEKNS